MKKIILLIVAVSMLLTGCRLRPRSVRSDKVEELAKKTINSGVYLTNEEPDIEAAYYGRHYTYSFKDARGIPFNVEMVSPYFSIVEIQKGLYEDYIYYYTDYRKSIMNYYSTQVEEIIDSADGISQDGRFSEILRISDEADLESLEDILLKIDDIYDFDYAYSGEDNYDLGGKSYWHDYHLYDYLIRYNKKQENVIFTENEQKPLTIEKIEDITKGLKEE